MCADLPPLTRQYQWNGAKFFQRILHGEAFALMALGIDRDGYAQSTEALLLTFLPHSLPPKNLSLVRSRLPGCARLPGGAVGRAPVNCKTI